MDQRHYSRVVFAYLCLLVLECRFRRNNRLCKLDVDDVSVLGKFLGHYQSSSVRIHYGETYPNYTEC